MSFNSKTNKKKGKCDPSCVGSNNDDAVNRDELVIMRMCNAGSTTENATYFATAYIKKPWKLIVNGGYPMGTACSGSFNLNEGIRSWNRFDGFDYVFPEQDYYDDWYLPQFTFPNVQRANTLYLSDCLEDLEDDGELDDEEFYQFQYQEFQLFLINSDKVEACNKADDRRNIVDQMFQEIKDMSVDYNVPENVEDSVGGMWQLINSYDCETGMVYLEPWEGNNEDKCGNVDDTYNNVDNRNCGAIWARLNTLKSNCEDSEEDVQPLVLPDEPLVVPGEHALKPVRGLLWILNLCFFGFFSILIIFSVFCMYRDVRGKNLRKKDVDNDTEDEFDHDSEEIMSLKE